MNIFLIGEVSSGKSSLLNAIAGGIISNASIQRETIDPEIYKFDKIDKSFQSFKKISILLESKHVNNKKFAKTNMQLGDPKIVCDVNGSEILFKSQWNLRRFNIYDFPGLNDSTDSSDIFFKSVKTNIDKCDCLLYVTKADSAFISHSEVDGFKKIIDLCIKRYKQTGKLIKVCIIVNKFDNPYDIDMHQITNEINDKLVGIPVRIENDHKDNKNTDFILPIRIYRISSHRLLISNIIHNKIDVPLSKFLHQEIKKIFQNANAIITKKQVDSIKSQNKISHNFIEFNEEIGHSLDSLSDSGSDTDSTSYNRNNPMYAKDWTNYMIKYQGDWNDFMEFISEFEKDLSDNQINAKVEWLCAYFNEITNFINVYSISTYVKEYKPLCGKFPEIISIFQQNKIIDHLVTIFIDWFGKNNKDEQLCLGFGIHMLNENIDISHKKSILKIIEQNVFNPENDKINLHHFHLLFHGLSMIEDYQLDVDTILKILKHNAIWSECNITFWKIIDFNNQKVMNDKHQKYRTTYVDKLMQHKYFVHKFVHSSSICNDIHMLIKLSLMDIKHLWLLHNENELPYELIKKYLGQIACLRTKTYIKDKRVDNIPYLFNENPQYYINSEILKYIQVRNDLFSV